MSAPLETGVVFLKAVSVSAWGLHLMSFAVIRPSKMFGTIRTWVPFCVTMFDCVGPERILIHAYIVTLVRPELLRFTMSRCMQVVPPLCHKLFHTCQHRAHETLV